MRTGSPENCRPGKATTAPAFAGYEESHRPLVEQSRSNLFTGLVAPKRHAGIWARNTTAGLPLVSATAGTEPLPDYARPRDPADPASGSGVLS